MFYLQAFVFALQKLGRKDSYRDAVNALRDGSLVEESEESIEITWMRLQKPTIIHHPGESDEEPLIELSEHDSLSDEY